MYTNRINSLATHSSTQILSFLSFLLFSLLSTKHPQKDFIASGPEEIGEWLSDIGKAEDDLLRTMRAKNITGEDIRRIIDVFTPLVGNSRRRRRRTIRTHTAQSPGTPRGTGGRRGKGNSRLGGRRLCRLLGTQSTSTQRQACLSWRHRR